MAPFSLKPPATTSLPADALWRALPIEKAVQPAKMSAERLANEIDHSPSRFQRPLGVLAQRRNCKPGKPVLATRLRAHASAAPGVPFLGAVP
jgi:hypothetical protein